MNSSLIITSTSFYLLKPGNNPMNFSPSTKHLPLLSATSPNPAPLAVEVVSPSYIKRPI
jgi:hypothetical protein